MARGEKSEFRFYNVSSQINKDKNHYYDIPYLKATYKGRKPVSERILKLDAECYQKGDLPLSNLLNKYCSYIVLNN